MYNNSIITNVYGNKIPKPSVRCAFLSVLLLDSVVMIDKKYCPQTFLKKRKYAVKKVKKNYIHEELTLDKSDESDDESDEENYVD